MSKPHLSKLNAAIDNPKAAADKDLLKEAKDAYTSWIKSVESLTTVGKEKVQDLTRLLNEYKDLLEVELILRRGSDFLKRQKGQMKLDNSVMEEFMMMLVDRDILTGLPTDFELHTGPQTAFMSMAFRPSSVASLNEKPDIILKNKDQDFTIGRPIFYKFSSDSSFEDTKTVNGELFLAVLAAECKVNYDKTMFQECAGTASRLKEGCPMSKYFALVEYLDMTPEDIQLTDIDNVYLLRHAKRLPYGKRNDYATVKQHHADHPIDSEVVFMFVQEIDKFISAVWYDPDEALARGSFK